MLSKLLKKLETLLSKSEAQEAFSDAIAIVKKILGEVKARNPQMELKFELKEKKDKER